MKKALRYNTGKPRLSLVSWEFVKGAAHVAWWAANQGPYKLHNWRKGLSWSETLDATMRHGAAITDGEWLDPTSKLPHIWHMSWNIMALCYYVAAGIGTNDFWRKDEQTKK